MKKIILILILFVFSGCDGQWEEDGSDFRNFLRDRHPYAELKEIELNSIFAYQINDTINNEIWIYTSDLNKDYYFGHKIIYSDKPNQKQ